MAAHGKEGQARPHREHHAHQKHDVHVAGLPLHARTDCPAKSQHMNRMVAGRARFGSLTPLPPSAPPAPAFPSAPAPAPAPAPSSAPAPAPAPAPASSPAPDITAASPGATPSCCRSGAVMATMSTPSVRCRCARPGNPANGHGCDGRIVAPAARASKKLLLPSRSRPTMNSWVTPQVCRT